MGKRFEECSKLIDKNKLYEVKEALEVIEKCQRLNSMKQLNYT